MKYLHTFCVQGVGPFPMDMLRFDQCWPARSEDVVFLTTTGPRVVELHKHARTKGEAELTCARWQSFGWHLVADSHRTTKLST